MRGLIIGTALFGSVLAVACGSGSGQQATSSAPTSAPTSVPQAVTATATPAVAAQATPATNPLAWMAGKVTAVADGKVTLQDGSSFTVDPQTRFSRLTPGTVADLQPGRVVAITATRQTDSTLLASLVQVLPSAPSATFLRQFPFTGGDLMTNGAIADVTGNIFSVSFTGGGAKVTLAPDGLVANVGSGTASDLKVGSSVFAQVKDGGVAQNVSIE